MWTTSRLTERDQIQAFLETDRLYAAYALGDLEPGMFEDCTWAAAERDGRIQALALHYLGLQPPPLFLMGEGEGLRAILEHELRPSPVYVTCLPQHLPLAQAFYAWQDPVPMWRMVLSAGRFRGMKAACERLGRRHAAELEALYAMGGGLAFSAAQLESRSFWGLRVAGRLVSVAGTHLVSQTYDVGAIGNVSTHPDHRRRGYRTATTSAVVRDLMGRGIEGIILNVSQDNDAAVRVYERLGFRRYCLFMEGPAERR